MKLNKKLLKEKIMEQEQEQWGKNLIIQKKNKTTNIESKRKFFYYRPKLKI